MPAREVQEGRHIALLRIHVERAIGGMKTFSILKETLPVSLARLSNQIVCVCVRSYLILSLHSFHLAPKHQK